MNKRRIIDLISLSLIVILFFVSFEVIKENKELKRELGPEYQQLIQETGYALSYMQDINWDETINNENMQQDFDEHQYQLENTAFTFMMLENDLNKLGHILLDISYFQGMLINQEELSEAEIEANKERVRTLRLLFLDMSPQVVGDGNTDWYDAMHGKDSPFIPLMETRLKYIE